MAQGKVVACEPLLVRYTKPVGSGQVPLSLREVSKFNKTAMPSEWWTGGWFWSFATPRSAADIRRRGHRAVGTEVITFIPPQDSGLRDVEAALSYDENLVAAVGSSEHRELMMEETAARGAA